GQLRRLDGLVDHLDPLLRIDERQIRRRGLTIDNADSLAEGQNSSDPGDGGFLPDQPLSPAHQIAPSNSPSSWIVFRVTDTGIGMTEEQVVKVFEPFIQADSSTTKKYGGTGLGLTITKAFCEIMGGEITVDSQFGTGSTFTIRLPATVSAPQHHLPLNTID
ncbi:MAG: ATP-binding protein, partial [Oscillatoria sp. Prado101]|nr:ATP-binding protein [Oscillatoria sp. Prado101]